METNHIQNLAEHLAQRRGNNWADASDWKAAKSIIDHPRSFLDKLFYEGVIQSAGTAHGITENVRTYRLVESNRIKAPVTYKREKDGSWSVGPSPDNPNIDIISARPTPQEAHDATVAFCKAHKPTWDLEWPEVPKPMRGYVERVGPVYWTAFVDDPRRSGSRYIATSANPQKAIDTAKSYFSTSCPEDWVEWEDAPEVVRAEFVYEAGKPGYKSEPWKVMIKGEWIVSGETPKKARQYAERFIAECVDDGYDNDVWKNRHVEWDDYPTGPPHEHDWRVGFIGSTRRRVFCMDLYCDDTFFVDYEKTGSKFTGHVPPEFQ